MIFLRIGYDSTYSTRCSIPPERPILVLLLVSECDPTVSDPRTKTGRIQDLWACAKESDEFFKSWEVILDNRVLFKKTGIQEVNVRLEDEILVRNSSIFTLNMPNANKFDVEPGSYPAVVDGYYLVLKPLSPGEHVLKYKITHESNIPGADLSQNYGDVTYFFNVN